MSQNVNVNLVPGNYPKEFHVSQYDVGRQLIANIVDSTGAYSIPSGATVTLVGTKPSGFGFTLNGTVGSGGVVTFSTTATVTAEYGRIPCEIRIESGNTVLGTANCMLIVEESPHQERVIDGNSETVIPELTILVERVEAAASSVLDMQVEADTLPAGSSATYSYDEETNTATFGIPQGEAGAGAAGVVASAYSASSTYAVGDYVIHDGNLYRCTTAIATAEAFTAAHWTQVVLGDDVSDLKGDLDALLPLIAVKKLVMNRFGLGRSDGDSNGAPERLHTALATCEEGDLITVPDGYEVAIYYYTVNGYVGNSYDDFGRWLKAEEGPFVITRGGLFSVVIRKLDNSAFTEQECYALNETIILYSSKPTKVNDIVFGAGNIDTANQPYYWGFQGNDYIYYAFAYSKELYTTRWRTENIVDLKKGTTITVKDGYRIYVFKYENGTVINMGWATGAINFNSDTAVRLIVDTVSDTKIPYTQWDNLNSIIEISEPSQFDDLFNAVNGMKELRVGEFVNGHLVAGGVIDDAYTNYRLSTKEIVAFPYGSKRTIKVNIGPKYLFAMRTGPTSTNLVNNLYWYRHGDTVTIPDGDNYYAISICNASGDDSHTAVTISPSENIGLSLLYEDGFDVLAHNDVPSKVLSNARLFFSSSNYNTMSKYAVIGHTSDCHGDYKRVENFFKFCDNCGADVACVTGDIVSYQPSQQIKWFNDLLLEHKTLPAVCTGNHDVYGNSLTDSDIYDFMFADIATKIGNATGKTWYYKDIASKKLRVISVNLYQYGGDSRWYTHFTDEQLSWIVTTIKNTPSNYGIIILSHASQVVLDNAKDANYGDFFQDVRLYNNTHNAVSGGVPLYDIVDAFISRTTLSKTYTQTGSPSSVSVSADFTSVDASVEFIAHLTGHFHQDSICYVPNRANKQLMLNVTCTNAIYGGAAYPYLADIQDQARNNMDATQDAFNMYVVDRDNKKVKVVRIGNDITYQMRERKYMEIPYV